jgi:hypothetical protein
MIYFVHRFSVGPLPLWAKKQMQHDTAPNLPPRQMDLPKGRWAQRLDAGGITVKSVYDSDSIIPFPSLQQGSYESSLCFLVLPNNIPQSGRQIFSFPFLELFPPSIRKCSIAARKLQVIHTSFESVIIIFFYSIINVTYLEQGQMISVVCWKL